MSQLTTRIEIIAGTFDLTGEIYADKVNDLLYIRPSCDGSDCTMLLGGVDDGVQFHMSDVELDRLSTQVRVFYY